MQIPVIKKIVAQYELEDLKRAEESLLEEKDLKIEIEGDDEGEQLTHIIAAIWIKEYMQEKNVPFPKALRSYTEKVRKSID